MGNTTFVPDYEHIVQYMTSERRHFKDTGRKHNNKTSDVAFFQLLTDACTIERDRRSKGSYTLYEQELSINYRRDQHTKTKSKEQTSVSTTPEYRKLHKYILESKDSRKLVNQTFDHDISWTEGPKLRSRSEKHIETPIYIAVRFGALEVA